MDRNIRARTTPWKGMKMSMPLTLHKLKTEAGELVLQSQKHSSTFYFVCFQRSAGSYGSQQQMQKLPSPKIINCLGQGIDTVLGRTKCFCKDATAVFSQMPHLPRKRKPVLSVPFVKSQALGPEYLWGLCSHMNYFTEQFLNPPRVQRMEEHRVCSATAPLRAGLPACPKTLQELHCSFLTPSRHTQQQWLQCEASAVVSYYSQSNKPLCLSKAFQLMCSAGLNAGWKQLVLGQPIFLCNMIHHFGSGSPGWNHK